MRRHCPLGGGFKSKNVERIAIYAGGDEELDVTRNEALLRRPFQRTSGELVAARRQVWIVGSTLEIGYDVPKYSTVG